MKRNTNCVNVHTRGNENFYITEKNTINTLIVFHAQDSMKIVASNSMGNNKPRS